MDIDRPLARLGGLSAGPEAAQRLRRQLIWQTALTLPLRVMFFSPKLIARMWGRLMGVMVWAWKDQS